MSESKKEECLPPKVTTGSAKGDGKAKESKQTPAVKNQQSDSKDIERAVYDGMQDLREEKPK